MLRLRRIKYFPATRNEVRGLNKLVQIPLPKAAPVPSFQKVKGWVYCPEELEK